MKAATTPATHRHTRHASRNGYPRRTRSETLALTILTAILRLLVRSLRWLLPELRDAIFRQRRLERRRAAEQRERERERARARRRRIALVSTGVAVAAALTVARALSHR
jgi:hypothetical protein